jgi:ERCC4-type nuclease
VPDDFVIARNPDPDSTLPYLVRIPVGERGIVLKAREMWPRTAKVYCHRAPGWPDDPEILERVAVRSCIRRGAAIDLVLDRGRENRSQFVITRIRGGREAIFWQSPRTTKAARPKVPMPTGRAQGIGGLVILVDSHERYPYTFSRQAGRGHIETRRRGLPAGDYAVELDNSIAVAVERKSLSDLASSLLSGKLRYALAELAALPRAAVVVEERYSKIFTYEHARPSVIADAVAEVQVRWPNVPIVFLETRTMAEEWTYRFLAAGLAELAQQSVAMAVELPEAGLIPRREPTTADVREWAMEQGLNVSDRGRLRPEIWEAYRAAH